MNIFIQWQETISDAYLTDTPSYFPFIEPNISLLPQGSLASIPSNTLITESDFFDFSDNLFYFLTLQINLPDPLIMLSYDLMTVL